MSYTVTAKRWDGGWELHIADVGVTQSRTLADADHMVRDYLRLDGHRDWDTAVVAMVTDLGPLGKRVEAVRKRTRAAEQSQLKAAKEAREVARALRERGLSVTDTATVLGVSRGRVSQLMSRKVSRKGVSQSTNRSVMSDYPNKAKRRVESTHRPA